MTRALPKDKEQVVSMLARCFDDNKSVNYIIPQDLHRTDRITRLMEYSFDYCQLFGEVYLSADRHLPSFLSPEDKTPLTSHPACFAPDVCDVSG